VRLVLLECLGLLLGAACGFLPLWLARRSLDAVLDRAEELDALNTDFLEFAKEALPRIREAYATEVRRKWVAEGRVLPRG
jgi:hypothetical protein